ncbi:CopG family antitoxin [Endozoicomonas sp. ISHI1]|uniref:CopG family antitoxin n=1 Tax=Endozoicomonas sp. ISHI1 TaxID=2825882 RepID=UPI00214918DA|nr:CopG family antitoxin [Endozoicomonas sp. ISHI1]
MKKTTLDNEEQTLLDALERGEYESVMTPERKAMLEAAARETFKKDKRINIRISQQDLLAIQSRARREGIPYQTLVSSILHKYLSGVLRDVSTLP